MISRQTFVLFINQIDQERDEGNRFTRRSIRGPAIPGQSEWDSQTGQVHPHLAGQVQRRGEKSANLFDNQWLSW